MNTNEQPTQPAAPEGEPNQDASAEELRPEVSEEMSAQDTVAPEEAAASYEIVEAPLEESSEEVADVAPLEESTGVDPESLKMDWYILKRCARCILNLFADVCNRRRVVFSKTPIFTFP